MMTYHREIRRNPQNAWQLAISAALTTWPHVTLSTHVEEGRRIILPLSEPHDVKAARHLEDE